MERALDYGRSPQATGRRHAHLSRIEYALRALCTLAARSGEPLTAEELADAQGLPVRFLRAILTICGTWGSSRANAATRAATNRQRPAAEITIGEVFRRLEGPLAEVRGCVPSRPATKLTPCIYRRSGSPCEPACEVCLTRSPWSKSCQASSPVKSYVL